MTPVMDDMMASCGEYAEESVNALSSLMPSAFSLGQVRYLCPSPMFSALPSPSLPFSFG